MLVPDERTTLEATRPAPGGKRIAFVVQRYGAEIVGGAESLCRSLAEMLVADYAVDVLTTCAREYQTWKNEYPAGVSNLRGVRVHRFPVDFPRDQRAQAAWSTVFRGAPGEAYHQYPELIRQILASSSADEQRAAVTLQGPYSTPLLDYLARQHDQYALVIFCTYLYPTTFCGAAQVPAAKTVLIPTAHDEAPIHLPVFREMFARFPHFIFLTPEERGFVETTFSIEQAAKVTIGMPIELQGRPDPERFLAKYGIEPPFLLYAGRTDAAKNVPDLLRYFAAAQGHLPAGLELVLIGQGEADIPRGARIRHLGMLPEADKLDAMAAATLFVNPSSFESFSIVILESMLCGTPVLINGRSAVLRGHIERSKGGLYFGDWYEFVEALNLLLDDEPLRMRMAQNGQRYVEQNYSPDAVHRKYLGFLAQAMGRGNRE